MTSGTTDDYQGERILGWMADLFPLGRSLTGRGVRETLGYLKCLVPLAIHEVPSGSAAFDWVVPDEWNVRNASLEHESGRRICDLADSALHVVGYSEPVDAWLTLEELAPRLHTLPEQPALVPYVTSYYNRTWGFCISEETRRGMLSGRYHARIDSSLEPGSLTYADLLIPGETEDEVLISTYVCHPNLMNDNLSGVVIATALARWVMQASRRYTYRFVWAPETVGVVAYLARHGAQMRERTRAGLVLTCLADPGPINYKQSRSGNTLIDRVVALALAESGAPYSVLPYFPWGSDERQYCSPGFDLPVGSLMRTPYGLYPEYHTSADDLSLASADRLGYMYALYVRVLEMLEANRRYRRREPNCEPQLGKRGIYRAPTRGVGLLGENPQHWVLGLAGLETDLLAIAERSGCRFSDLVEAAEELCAHGVLDLVDRPAFTQ